jgi:hypothetical protein
MDLLIGDPPCLPATKRPTSTPRSTCWPLLRDTASPLGQRAWSTASDGGRTARRPRRLGAWAAWGCASLGTAQGPPVVGPSRRARTAAYGGAGAAWWSRSSSGAWHDVAARHTHSAARFNPLELSFSQNFATKVH